MLHAKLMVLSFKEPELWATDVYIAGIGTFDICCSSDDDLDSMSFIYELDPYF